MFYSLADGKSWWSFFHPSGLAIALVGVKTENGKVYREIPLANVNRGEWMDLIVRAGKGRLDFFCNGILKSTIRISQELCSPFINDLYIGILQCILGRQC